MRTTIVNILAAQEHLRIAARAGAEAKFRIANPCDGLEPAFQAALAWHHAQQAYDLLMQDTDVETQPLILGDRMTDGENPSAGWCRVCGAWAVPQYDGPYTHGVCSMMCYDEWRWRETLRIMRKSYRRKGR